MNHNKQIFKFIIFILLIFIIIIIGCFIKWIKEPDIFEPKTTITYDNWSNISNDIKFISKEIDVCNNLENKRDVYIRVIDKKGNIVSEPTLIKSGESKTITTNWQIFNKRFVQAQSIEGTDYYNFKITHEIR